ncbi:unnamed protein product [marine sediment metagenome]|uniref:Uncharacterized protein n=1 Tax=marine sediment metagenome TaxID=412755 RepID=X1QRA7_9ZZZZ
MPKQKRWQLKRQLDQAVNDQDRSQRNLIIVAADFDGVHQNYYNALATIVQGIEFTKAAINSFKDAI